MAENPITITRLNDFIFCPVSIYFHNLDYDTEKLIYQCSDQLDGTAAHTSVDKKTYSTGKHILQGISVGSMEYNLTGKIDVFDTKTGVLTERKKKIRQIYDGYVFQLYGQYYALTEMGYSVKKIRLHSMDDNKTYNVPLPSEDTIMREKFLKTLRDITAFSFDAFHQTNAQKCERCIYEPLCSFSAKEGRF